MNESDFDKYLLTPRYSDLHSREEVNLYNDFLGLGDRLPFVLSPMTSVSNAYTCSIAYQNGAVGALHRYSSIEEQCKAVRGLTSQGELIGGSIGTTKMKMRIEMLYNAGVNFLIIDVAHGYTQDCIDTIGYIKSEYDIPVISGNIVTVSAARAMVRAGADALRVGIGSGSACTTRQVCGVGYNQLDAIMEIHSQFPDTPIYSCGGIRNSGDIVKALAFGSSGVIIGKLFAEALESPNHGTHYGMASKFAEEQRADLEGENGTHHIIAPEGSVLKVEKTKTLAEIIDSLQAGVKAGFAYMGARNIKELWDNAQWTMD